MSRFKKEEKIKLYTGTKKDKIATVIMLIVLLALLADSAVLCMQGGFFDVVVFGESTHFSRRRILKFAVLVAACVVVSLYNFKDKNLEKKSTKYLTGIAYAITPIVAHIFLEFANPAGTNRMWELKNWRYAASCIEVRDWLLVTLVIMYLCMLFFYAISCNVRFAAVMVCILSGMFGLTNYYVYQFRGIPFLASDLTTIQTALNVAGGYSYQINYPIIVMLMGLFFWAAMLCKMPKKPSRHKVWYRVVVLALSVAILGGAVNQMMYTKMLTDEWLKVSINNFSPIKSYKKSGQVLTFVRSIKLLIVEKPENYSAALAEEIAKPYIEEYEKIAGADYERPNVICIMDEAFTDFTQIAEFNTSEDALPYYHSLDKNTTKGALNVSVFGGRTATTEFEFLTGMTSAFMPKSTTPYQIFIKDDIPSTARTMKAENYQGIKAFHPFKANGYSRDKVYPYMGFNDFISIEDLEITDDMKVRNFMSDSEDFKIIINEFEKAKKESDDPFFLFNVTMQNHTPYDKHFDNLSEDITINGPCAGDRANRYINLIKLTDDAIRELIEYFSKVDEPTVIVLFGDHEPKFSDKFYGNLLGKPVDKLTPEESMDMYKTAYMVWSNFDRDTQAGSELSSNYLCSMVKQEFGMKLSPYELYLTDLREEVPVITGNGYIGADGKYYDLYDKSSPYYEKVYNYSVLVYNNMFDESHRVKDFFD